MAETGQSESEGPIDAERTNRIVERYKCVEENARRLQQHLRIIRTLNWYRSFDRPVGLWHNDIT